MSPPGGGTLPPGVLAVVSRKVGMKGDLGRAEQLPLSGGGQDFRKNLIVDPCSTFAQTLHGPFKVRHVAAAVAFEQYPEGSLDRNPHPPCHLAAMSLIDQEEATFSVGSQGDGLGLALAEERPKRRNQVPPAGGPAMDPGGLNDLI